MSDKMKPQCFRKKPVIIEAIQWTGHNTLEIMEFMQVNDMEGYVKRWGNLKLTQIFIDTLEGRMIADTGDWIIKEPYPTKDRTFYPCKPDIFEATYELVGDK